MVSSITCYNETVIRIVISHGKQLSVAMQVLWYLVLLATMRLSYGSHFPRKQSKSPEVSHEF
jgi:hypothetical protein